MLQAFATKTSLTKAYNINIGILGAPKQSKSRKQVAKPYKLNSTFTMGSVKLQESNRSTLSSSLLDDF